MDGYSRGSEAALLVSEHFPQVFQGTLLYAPNDRPLGAYPGPGAAWTLAGRPVATGLPIPTDKLSGPVLAIGGGRDTLTVLTWLGQVHANSG